jgi:carboxyl-terminal processing protease
MNHSVRRVSLILTSVLVFSALAGGVWDTALASGKESALSSRIREYTEVVAALEEWSADEVERDELVFSSVDGMIRTLDPHSSFFAPVEYSDVRDKQAGSYYGVGLLVSQRDGRVVVVTPMEGGPAGRAGFRAGDVIAGVDGKDTTEINYERVTELLRGPSGTSVEVTVRREGVEEPLLFTVTREAISTKAVPASFMLDAETGYVRVTDFTQTTSIEFDAALLNLTSEGMKKIVVDLRGNGGGVLDAAIAIADRFLAKGQLVTYMRGATYDTNLDFHAPGEKPRLDIPVVVLVDHGSASASEIVAGAIQDHDRGLVVGQTTWGKGLVQSVFNLRYGAGLALTTARYYTPSGRNIQRDYSSLYDYFSSEETTAEARPDRFETATGRTVFGGGGIRPDLEVARIERPRFAQLLEARSVTFDFAVAWHARHENDPATITPEMLLDLERLASERAIAPAEEITRAFADPELRPELERMLSAEIAAIRDGYAASYPWRVQGDNQIEAAVKALPDAARLAAEAAGSAKSILARVPPKPATDSASKM